MIVKISMAAEKPPQEKKTPKPIDWSEFLAEVPPYTQRVVSELSLSSSWVIDKIVYKMDHPTIMIYCTVCNRKLAFDFEGHREVLYEEPRDFFLHYRCRLCMSTSKTFAIRARHIGNQSDGEVEKMGEMPSFGPPIPARLNEILKDDRELFFKGRRAESQGMGIGAFSYYRRVVENRKNSLIDQIIKVAERTNISPETIEILKSAKEETQFQRSIESIKDAIPEALEINGENPLTLLYRPLSGGLHDWSEDECLEEARSIRIVLTELCERVGQALKDQSELDEAVKRLKRPKENK